MYNNKETDVGFGELTRQVRLNCYEDAETTFSFSRCNPFKGTVARDFFSMDLLFMGPDFEAKRIYFSFSFSQRNLNISTNPRCRLLQGF
jgi:hypothetical protein